MAKQQAVNTASKMHHSTTLKWFFFTMLTILTFLFYYNTTENLFSFQDKLVNFENPSTIKGLSGIPEILSTPLEQGNRFPVYRPLGRLSFALEYQFTAGSENLPKINHFFNILLYLIGVWLLYRVLKRLFQNYGPWLAFLATVLFLAHPVHSELVNSLYYRDYLLSFIFSFLAVEQLIKWADYSRIQNLVIGSFSFFLALLSNETAFIFLLLVPLTLFFFTEISRAKLIQLFSIETIVAVIALAFPLAYLPAEENAILFYENPLVNAGLPEQFSTAFYALGWYAKMLVFPVPLSFYYGFDILPISTWDNLWVWLSFAVYISLTVFALATLPKKNVVSFFILFFLISILPFSNLFTPVRGIIAERFLFVPSVAFSVFVVWLFFVLFRIKPENNRKTNIRIAAVTLLVLALVIPAQLITFERNKAWKTDIFLYRNDLKTYPQSAFINNILGRERLKPVKVEMAKEVSPYKFILSDIKEVENYSKSAVAIDSTLSESWERLGYVSSEIHGWMAVRRMESYMNQNKNLESEMEEANAALYIETANQYYDKALQYNCPDSAYIYFRKAMAYRLNYQFDESLKNFETALQLNADNFQYRAEYVQTLLKGGKFKEALVENDNLRQQYPESDVPYINLGGYQYFAGDTIAAIKNYEMAVEKGTKRPEVGKLLYYYYKQKGDVERANYFMERSYEAEKANSKN